MLRDILDTTMAISKTCFVLSAFLITIASTQEMDKHGPQGFVGMRGKKYLEDGTEFYKRKPQFFVGVKGKKSFYDFLQNPEIYFKRSPMGFMGVRGKRFPVDTENYFQGQEYLPKRDGSLIGRIDYSSNEIPEPQFHLLDELFNEYMQKVESPESNETEDRITNEVEKRANVHPFFGVRGKKTLQIKRPYDVSFRGKFIGVRGKKDLSNGPKEIKFLLDGPYPKRKSQMGFFGMRGKKWVDDSSPEAEQY